MLTKLRIRAGTVTVTLCMALLLAVAQVISTSGNTADNQGHKPSSENQIQVTTVDSATSSAMQAQGGSAQSAVPNTGEQAKWRVTAAGGVVSSSSNYILGGTLGESFVGPNSGATRLVNQGFWQRFDKIGCCVGTTGNVNVSVTETPDLSDLSLLIAYLTQTPRPILPCLPEANVNTLGAVDLSDLSLLIAYLTQTPRPALPNCP